ncbi:protein of unknown function [Fictibacillus solisalsi]|uniref:Uncharacterized protein n=1 Tax=Fictibacillus solisalsi TaxID=459525 RepID=A0A1H0C0Z6_9BACL|nr:DUF1259 domain-containing protein [Fictibacillus solisalsi]SDN51568.1 protein of unknown function [Fictibacillus solisalsi]
MPGSHLNHWILKECVKLWRSCGFGRRNTGVSRQLVSKGFIIGALHNHWLFIKPTILYIHFQSVEPPLTFAKKAAEALVVLKE